MDAGIHRTCFLVDVCAISPFADASRGPWMELLDDRSEAVDNDPRAAQMVGDEVAGLVGRGRGQQGSPGWRHKKEGEPVRGFSLFAVCRAWHNSSG